MSVSKSPRSLNLFDSTAMSKSPFFSSGKDSSFLHPWFAGFIFIFSLIQPYVYMSTMFPYLCNRCARDFECIYACFHIYVTCVVCSKDFECIYAGSVELNQ